MRLDYEAELTQRSRAHAEAIHDHEIAAALRSAYERGRGERGEVVRDHEANRECLPTLEDRIASAIDAARKEALEEAERRIGETKLGELVGPRRGMEMEGASAARGKCMALIAALSREIGGDDA
jgi:hypothetical protein